eukprot:scaffold49001_cov22-Attheya_sp.AAC.1
MVPCDNLLFSLLLFVIIGHFQFAIFQTGSAGERFIFMMTKIVRPKNMSLRFVVLLAISAVRNVAGFAVLPIFSAATASGTKAAMLVTSDLVSTVAVT